MAEFTATVNFGGGLQTRVYAGAGAVNQIGRVLRDLNLVGGATDRRLFLIADSGLPPSAPRAVETALRTAEIKFETLTIDLSERTKNIATTNRIYDWLAERRAERNEPLVALGGGVASDLVGFVAASWLRGVPFGIVSTTLLAMADAGVGGKTGVNIAAGKNLVGAFKPAEFVIHDTLFLQTLDERNWLTGLAEVIKHGLVLSKPLLEFMEREYERIGAREHEATLHIIAESVRLKARVAERDFQEKQGAGGRMALNYGHTVGHALEVKAGYGALTHGEAIALGMMVAANIAVEAGLADAESLRRQARILQRYGLPTESADFNAQEALNIALSDKKVRGGKLTWVLMTEPGRAVTRNDIDAAVALTAARRVLRA